MDIEPAQGWCSTTGVDGTGLSKVLDDTDVQNMDWIEGDGDLWPSDVDFLGRVPTWDPDLTSAFQSM